MNTRQIGLIYRREVINLLKRSEYEAEGAGMKPRQWVNGRMIYGEADIFEIGDIISYKNGIYMLHQVTTIDNKSSHEKKIQERGLPCWLWCRYKVKNSVHYKIFYEGMEITEDGCL